MSRNADRIRKALEARGATNIRTTWTPVGHGVGDGPGGNWDVFAEHPSGSLYFCGFTVAEVLALIAGEAV